MAMLIDTMSDLGRFIEQYIQRRGWTRRQAAINWGYKDSSVLDKIINDPNRVPELSTLDRLARNMGVPLARLLEKVGYPVETDTLHRISDATREYLNSLTPDELDDLVEAARRLRGGGE